MADHKPESATNTESATDTESATVTGPDAEPVVRYERRGSAAVHTGKW